MVGTVKDVTIHAAAEVRLRLVAELTTRLATANDPSDVGGARTRGAAQILVARRTAPSSSLEHEASAVRLVADAGSTKWRVNVVASARSISWPPAADAVQSREILAIVDQEEFAARYPGLGT